LNGLDLRLSPGLNVLIGARGSGKTSLIEAIRYGLGISANSSEAARRAVEHARSILQSGQVTIQLEDGNEVHVVSRAGDAEAADDIPLAMPIVFAQSEIENVGLLPAGRMKLIDDFTKLSPKEAVDGGKLVTSIRSATAELASLFRDLADLQSSVAEIPNVTKALAEAEQVSSQLTKTSAAAEAKKKELDTTSAQLAQLSARQAFFERATGVTEHWVEALDSAVLFAPELEEWSGTGPDPLARLRLEFHKSIQTVETSMATLRSIKDAIRDQQQLLVKQRAPFEAQARTLRTEIEALREGAGLATRRAQELKERRDELRALEKLANERKARVTAIQERRGKLLDELDELRERRFAKRSEVARRINAALQPSIKVSVTRAANTSQYEATLINLLRGSGLKFSELAAVIAREMPPRELLEAVELNDFDTVASVVGIGRDRAARLVSHLRELDLGDLAAARVEDLADLYLLDGGDYKHIDHLSTGQRCTVVLPILLEHSDRILILDQPEDHIDNAFVVETVIRALKRRGADAQIIISSHNANIPVLGDANLVVHLASDGRRGFVRHCGDLEDEKTVETITNLMEGGIEAFRRRAEVYGRF
jgi:DNA repair ATPase RecN